MHYYEVLVATTTYHGREALTYSHEETLERGAIVKVNLRSKPVLGIILRAVPRPSFDIKQIISVAPFPTIPSTDLSLMAWMNEYYPAPLGSIVRQFAPPTDTFPKPALKLEGEQPTMFDSLDTLPPIGREQRNALDIIKGPGTFLLHGITGSGKSRVYLELTIRSMQEGKSALVLTPEIGLTTQLTDTFRQILERSVYVLHSQLTVAERRNIYYELLQRREPCVVIGPRSALFSPLRDIGLIVLDESHDTAYKNESAPHYRSGRVAAKLARTHNASLVLGSATPSIEDYYLASVKKRPIIAMRELAKQSNTPVTLEVVDLRKADLFKRNRVLSDILIEKISNAISRGEQALVFLNRRGTANMVLCRNCGWQSLCPNCDLSLTYHADIHKLRCHVCGFMAGLPTSCPVCKETEILFKSIGTKAVVETLKKLFPTARIQRFDTDAKKSERLEHHLSSIVAGHVDIVVGTQMITKGLDLPKLSVVGIVNADSSLSIPDYTAAEQTYQIVSQVIGRVGRGHLPGTVIIQTYDPQNTTLLAAINRDWDTFYSAELSERRIYRFPPFVSLLKLRVLRASNEAAEKAGVALAETIIKKHPGAIVEGPAPSFHPRNHGRYSWQLLVKHRDRSTLVNIISEIPSGWSYDIDPTNLL